MLNADDPRTHMLARLLRGADRKEELSPMPSRLRPGIGDAHLTERTCGMGGT